MKTNGLIKFNRGKTHGLILPSIVIIGTVAAFQNCSSFQSAARPFSVRGVQIPDTANTTGLASTGAVGPPSGAPGTGSVPSGSVNPATPTPLVTPIATTGASAPDNINPPSGLDTVNSNCTVSANHVSCDLLPKSQTRGKLSEIGVASGLYTTFKNNTGVSLQINQVSATTGEQLDISEYCVFLDDFRTGQLTAGIGEVGCFQKVPGEPMPSLRWGDTTALAVAPGSTITIGFNTTSKISMDFVLDVTEQTSGVYSYRAPQIDESWMCDGVSHSTTYLPWQNTSSANMYLSGAQIYVANVGLLTLDSACLYVLDVNQAVKFSYCDGVNKRGFVSFASQTIAPGEYVVGQARNSCSNAGGWDWVAYMQVSR